MFVKGFNPMKHTRKLDKKDMFETELYLMASRKVISNKYGGSTFYHLSVIVASDGTAGSFVIGGAQVVQYLSMIENVKLDDPLAIKLYKVPSNQGQDANSIEFVNADILNDFFNSDKNDVGQYLLPLDLTDTEETETKEELNEDDVPF